MSSMFKLSEINRNSLFAVIVCGSNIFLFSHSQRVVVVVVSLPGIEVLWVAIAHLLCARVEICVRFTSDHQCAIRANEMYTPNGANDVRKHGERNWAQKLRSNDRLVVESRRQLRRVAGNAAERKCEKWEREKRTHILRRLKNNELWQEKCVDETRLIGI